MDIYVDHYVSANNQLPLTHTSASLLAFVCTYA